jgi:uncharacterized membrane protein HdeD (DUF308 family)
VRKDPYEDALKQHKRVTAVMYAVAIVVGLLAIGGVISSFVVLSSPTAMAPE